MDKYSFFILPLVVRQPNIALFFNASNDTFALLITTPIKMEDQQKQIAML